MSGHSWAAVVAELLRRARELGPHYARAREFPNRDAARALRDAGTAFKRHDDTAAKHMPADSHGRATSAVFGGSPHYRRPVNDLRASSSELTEELASRLHELWRKPRLGPDGRFEPRPKQVRDDPDWVAAHGTDQVDIANTAYRDLPLDYRRENQESAKVATPLVLDEHLAGRDPSRTDFVEASSSRVHDAWLERNRAWAPPEQSLPYDRLTEEEKEKDRVVIKAAIDLLKEQFRDTY